jgi:hypothetical protein
MKRRDCRETKDLIINGHIYTLVKGRIDRPCKTDAKPNFLGYPNWALQSIVKLTRKKKPSKNKDNE